MCAWDVCFLFTMQAQSISPLHSDSQISSFWDADAGKYFHYPRRSKDGLRAIGLVTTSRVDEPWPEPDRIPVVLARDQRDPPEVDLYTNAAQKYPLAANTYLAFPTPYYHYNRPAERAHLVEPTNVNTSAAGEGRVAILDAAGREIDGFGLADARYINGSYLDKTVAWRTGTDVSRLADQPVRLRFVMRGTRLYSFQFQ